ncbi:MAG: sugar ABC transporter ATP-binding protein [Paracoccaceae bacterium]
MTAQLDATGVAKSFGPVAALRNASLSVRAGEVHALLGANGAGKSTLIKILTGAVRPDRGKILVRGAALSIHSPAGAIRAGMVPVYQEPAMIPDLSVADTLRLTATPVAPFTALVADLGIGNLDLSAVGRDLPLATLRILDLARALAREPDVLILDEMTAALPADLTERVLEVVARQADAGRSVIFISHRFAEIQAICHRATVLRDGETVGVLDIAPGVEEEIVDLMLGGKVERSATVAAPAARPAGEAPRLRVRGLGVAGKLADVSLDLYPGEAVGVVALEGQGQDELFDVLAGDRRPSIGGIEVDGTKAHFRHPADAIAAGLAYVPGDRAEALLMQRSVRENVALPLSAPIGRWGPLPIGHERAKVSAAIERLQIETRAQGEVQRLSGGNQQKVTIARWIAADAQTLLCFDPTRGIDVRTKHEIYRLMRDLTGQGKAILYYTSDLSEVPLVCDRVLVIFGGRLVGEFPASASQGELTRAAYGLAREPQGAAP